MRSVKLSTSHIKHISMEKGNIAVKPGLDDISFNRMFRYRNHMTRFYFLVLKADLHLKLDMTSHAFPYVIFTGSWMKRHLREIVSVLFHFAARSEKTESENDTAVYG